MSNHLLKRPRAGIEAFLKVLDEFDPNSPTVHAEIVAFGRAILCLPVSLLFGMNPLYLGNAYLKKVQEFRVDSAMMLANEVREHMRQLAFAWAGEYYTSWMQQIDAVGSWQGDSMRATALLQQIGTGIIETMQKNPDLVSIFTVNQKYAIVLGYAARTHLLPFDRADKLVDDLASAFKVEIIIDSVAATTEEQEHFEHIGVHADTTHQPTPPPSAA